MNILQRFVVYIIFRGYNRNIGELRKMNTDPGAVRNFKDFLQLYNKMTEMCFQRCVVNINIRKLDAEEISCVDDCAQKFISYNNKLMQNFIRAQGVLLNKRIADVEQQQISTELQSKELETVEPKGLLAAQ